MNNSTIICNNLEAHCQNFRNAGTLVTHFPFIFDFFDIISLFSVCFVWHQEHIAILPCVSDALFFILSQWNSKICFEAWLLIKWMLYWEDLVDSILWWHEWNAAVIELIKKFWLQRYKLIFFTKLSFKKKTFIALFT